MRSYVGNVNIREHATGFEMKANREGFIESNSFQQLKLFVKFCIYWATIYREFYLRQKAKESSDVARKYLEGVLDEKIEKEKVVTSAVDYIQKEVRNIVNYLPSKEKRIVQKSLSKATDAILQYEKSNTEELRHLRLIASTSTLLLIFSHEVKSLLGLLENHTNTLEIIKEKLDKSDQNQISYVQNDLNESKIRFEDLLGLTSLISVDSKKASLTNLSLKERIAKARNAFKIIIDDYDIDISYDDVPNNIIIHNILEAELYSIVLNVLSNSIKAVIAGGEEKRIKFVASKVDGKNVITILDTGIGVGKDMYEEIFIPFIADPSNLLYPKLERNLNPADKYIVGTGSGLGLSIVKDIIQLRNGSISFQEPTETWKTKLVIELP